MPFRVALAGVEEVDDPAWNALAKARDVAGRTGIPGDGAVLGADTVVRLDDEVIGKPPGAPEADAMLAELSGRTHVVETAIALLTPSATLERIARTSVTFRDLSRAARAWYLDAGEWRDRAAGYAIQGRGAMLVRRIDGDHTNVIGLPLAMTVEVLEEAGLSPWR